MPPFEVIALSPGRPTAVLLAESPLLSGHVIDPSDSASYWVALPVLPLDTAYIQSFADLKSDRRILALSTMRLGLMSHVSSDVPIGVMASIPLKHLLIAARNLGGVVDIVVYQWRWNVT